MCRSVILPSPILTVIWKARAKDSLAFGVNLAGMSVCENIISSLASYTTSYGDYYSKSSTLKYRVLDSSLAELDQAFRF